MTARALAASLVDMLPFTARQFVRAKAANGFVKSQPFSGVYESFAEVDMVAAGKGHAAKFVQAGLRQRFDQASGLLVLSRQHAMLPLLAATFARKVRILDWGGAGGIDYLNVRTATDAVLDYVIVERPEIVNVVSPSLDLRFLETMPEKSERFDIVYSWGAIHYHPDPLALLMDFAQYQPQFILICGTPFARFGFVRRQKNAAGTLPQWVISLTEAEKIMDDCGYALSMRATDEHEYNVDNYPRDQRVAHDAMLLFRRKTDAA